MYTFQLNVSEPLTNYFSSQQTTIDIIPGGFLCKFNGVQPIQDYRTDLKIEIECQDLDTNYLANQDPFLTINVNCIDLTQNNICQDTRQKYINVNKTESEQKISKYSVQPYTVQSWKVTTFKNGTIQTFVQIIVFLEDNFKELQMNYSKGYNMRPINSYENLNFTYLISVTDQPMVLDYSITIIYDFEVLKILQPKCYSYQFRLFNHYYKFSKGNEINFKFLVQYINDIINIYLLFYIMPAQHNLKLTLIYHLYVHLLLTLRTINLNVIINCLFSSDYPYNYQLRILLNEQDYINYKSKKSDNSIILYAFQSSNKFQILLPYSNTTVIVQVMDTLMDQYKLQIKKYKWIRSN